jgi:hypothetical protein
VVISFVVAWWRGGVVAWWRGGVVRHGGIIGRGLRDTVKTAPPYRERADARAVEQRGEGSATRMDKIQAIVGGGCFLTTFLLLWVVYSFATTGVVISGRPLILIAALATSAVLTLLAFRGWSRPRRR